MPDDDPRPDFTVVWTPCAAEASCRGIQVDGKACLAHAPDGAQKFLERLAPGADLDLRGTKISSAQLATLMAAFREQGAYRHRVGEVRLGWAWFSGDAAFYEMRFDGPVDFENAMFSGSVDFERVTCAGTISFRNAQFEGPARLTYVDASALYFHQARFARSASFEAHAKRMSFAGTRFEGGATLRVGWCEVNADQAFFGAPSSIGGSRRLPTDGPWVRGDSATPRLLSLAGSDVGNVVLVDVDLSDCTFVGAFRLDQLRMDGRLLFATPPGRWRYTRRRVLADECEWRGWSRNGFVHGEVGPERQAVLYRSLRKAFEDGKNEAGAGDFYYGEMEARRHSPDTSRAEKVILWFYWLLSGYGKRAARAVAALVVLVVTVATLLIIWGQPFGHAARIAVGAVVFRDDRTDLTEAGEWTVLAARFLGPVLLALAVLAVRARVKR